ncbi:MAG: hypothetical protein V4553_20165 [Bacteroidota bacterium]
MAVTSVSSSNSDISVVNGTTTPVLTLDNVNGVTKSYYDPTSSIQTQLNSKANTSVFILKSTLNADITTALQSALNTYPEVVIDGSPGQYVINAKLTMLAGVVLRGVNNATIACGSTPTGDLSTLMRYIEILNSDCVVSNITFKPSVAGFPSLASYDTSCIHIESAGNLIINCTFNFSFAYGLDVYAVWCSTSTALYNKIINNKCYTVGIQYAQNSASYTLCDGNLIINAGTDGLQGTGNGGVGAPCMNNIVSNNIIIGAGYSGIEDQQYIDGTIIKNNVILNSGQASGAPAAGQGMGISAVGSNSQIIGNEINGFLNYGIEAGRGLLVAENTIIEPTGLQFGIFVNEIFSTVNYQSIGTSVVNNNITGCSTAIQAEGDYYAYINIEGNTVKDFKNKGINVQSIGSDVSANISNNTVILTAPNTVGSGNTRSSISTDSYPLLTIFGFIRICNNNVNYLSSATGGSGAEVGIYAGHSGTLVENNVVNTNNISTSGPTNIYTYSDLGNVLDAVKYINNKSYGTNATVGISATTNIVLIGNNWTGGDTMVFIDVVKTATNAAYTITAAGTLTKLPVITANRIVTLPTASANTGRILKIWNQNTSGTFKWSFSGVVKDAANTTITILVNSTWYVLESDGTNWNKTN